VPIALSLHVDQADFLAQRYPLVGSGDDGNDVDVGCLDDNSNEHIRNFAGLISIIAMIIIPLQFVATVIRGYYDELGTGIFCCCKGLCANDGDADGDAAGGAARRMEAFVRMAMPRFMTTAAVEETARVVADDRDVRDEDRDKALTWKMRFDSGEREEVCDEITAAVEHGGAQVKARVQEKAVAARERALVWWGRISKLLALIPVVVTAFLDGSLVLHKVIDPETLEFTGDGVPANIVLISMYAPLILILLFCFRMLFGWLARRRARAEKKAEAEERSEQEMRDTGSGRAESGNRSGGKNSKNSKNSKDGKDGKNSKDGKDGKDGKSKKKWYSCTSRGFSRTAAGCTWTAVALFFGVAFFGLYVKALAAVAAFTGQAVSVSRLVLNVVDIIYVVVAVIVAIPRMAAAAANK
jgi:hypothetical protein